jgi:hypothetical protein
MLSLFSGLFNILLPDKTDDDWSRYLKPEQPFDEEMDARKGRDTGSPLSYRKPKKWRPGKGPE